MSSQNPMFQFVHNQLGSRFWAGFVSLLVLIVIGMTLPALAEDYNKEILINSDFSNRVLTDSVLPRPTFVTVTLATLTSKG